jgi:hypothetical protein
MIERHRVVTVIVASAGIVGAALTGAALAAAEPLEPAPAPVTTVPAPPPAAPSDPQGMTPNQPPVPAGDPALAPAAAPVFQPSVPEIQNPTYGSGGGGGVFGTLKDLWHQAQNPYYAPDEVMQSGRGAAPPPGAGPAPALPPGYVSTNAPGSETPATGDGGGPATGRPALPPGYYSTSGPPPPGYQFVTPGPNGAAPTTTAVTAPSP